MGMPSLSLIIEREPASAAVPRRWSAWEFRIDSTLTSPYDSRYALHLLLDDKADGGSELRPQLDAVTRMSAAPSVGNKAN